jgi:FkbM family methyltransferase
MQISAITQATDTLRRVRSLVANSLCHPRFGSVITRLFHGRIPSQGFIFDVDNDYFPAVNAASLFWGFYEMREIDYVRRFLRSDLDAVEFGSGIGAVSMSIIKKQERDRKLICVEPNPFLIETLKKNVRLNAPWKQVGIVNRAVDYSGQDQVGLGICKNNLGSRINTGEMDDLTWIRTTTLRELLSEYDIGDFVLVSDAEGAEVGMIIEDAQSFSRCRQLIIELHASDYEEKMYTIQDLREMLESAYGFRLKTCWRDVHVFDKD